MANGKADARGASRNGKGARPRVRRGERKGARPEALDVSALEAAGSIEVANVSLPLDAGLATAGASELARRAISRALGVASADVVSFSLRKRSVDARKKGNVHFNATYSVTLSSGAAAKIRLASGVQARPASPLPTLEVPNLSSRVGRQDGRIVVAGTGPAGLFCALYLAEAGLRPLVVERGADVDARIRAIENFNRTGELDSSTNVQFGEGGAGTFSDGKLTTGTKSPHIRHVLEAFVAAGAPEEILWQAKPHIGTDKLPSIVKNIRERIVAAGGEVRFRARLCGVELDGGALRAVTVAGEDGCEERIAASRVVVACGHSARDVFELLRDEGFALERKPFSMGVRIEHPASLIDRTQYGSAAGHPALGAADYKLAVHVPDGATSDGEPRTRGVYTFCMCPGGEVVAAASEEDGVVVNGMSRFARDGENSNAALLADVRPGDLPGDDVLAGALLQRRVERAAYRLARDHGGAPFSAPAQTVGDFLARGASAREGGRAAANAAASATPLARPTYPRGVAWCDLHECLPDFVAGAIERALPLLDAKLHGFAHPGAVLTAPETRSSSPVRMVRGKNFQAKLAAAAHAAGEPSVAAEDEPRTHVYPCGEGAGYAGGIMSAAVDGLRVAEAIAREIEGAR